MLLAAPPMAASTSQSTVPDSPSSGYLEFPQRQPAATSSEEAANAALLAQTQRSSGTASSNGEVRLQAVLISSGDDAEQEQAGLKHKIRKAALGLGQSPPKRSSSTAEAAKPLMPPPNKRRFSLNALKVPFLSTRKTSGHSVAAPKAAPVRDDQAVTVDLEEGSGHGARSIEQTMLQVTYVDSNEGTTIVAPELPPKELGMLHGRDRAALPPPRSALSRPNSPSRAANRSVSAHRVSFSPSTDEAAEAREQALAVLAREEEQKLEEERKAEIKRRKKEEKLNRKRNNAGRLRGLKSFSTGNLLDISRITSRESVRSDPDADVSRATKEADNDLGLARPPQHRRFSLDRAGIRLHGVRGKGKAKPAKVKVTKKQAIAARHAKLLEQVINAGMGLYPIDAVDSVGPRVDEANRPTKARRDAASKPRTVPVASQAQLRELKKALMDMELANHIIGELRHMQIPERTDSLSHLGAGAIDTGHDGSHGKDRILCVASEESTPPGPDQDVVAAIKASAAEEALRKLEGQYSKQDTASEPSGPGLGPAVQQRTSSLAAEAAVADAVPAASSLVATLPTVRKEPVSAAAAPGTRPRKVVCLDCGEHEAHRRHADRQKLQELGQDDGRGRTAGREALVGGAAALGIAAVAAGAVAGSRPTSATAEDRSDAQDDGEVAFAAASIEERPRDMARSKSSPLLPVLEGGRTLLGSTPVQMLLSPTAAFIGTTGQMSGAFGALADASGAAIRATTDMDAVRPPLDRMAIFVHWWGFELTLPKPTMNYLETAHSVSGAFLSFLQTMAVSGGVPELQPFIRYISVYMDVEFKAIKEQDRGHGVCVAATWLMPLALVPRAWDYSYDPATAVSAAAVSAAAVSTAPNGGAAKVSPVSPSPPLQEPMMPLPPLSSLTGANSPMATPTKPRHVFRKAGSGAAVESMSVSAVPVPKRNLSPSQMAAIQAARTERMPADLEAPPALMLHSRSSSADSKEGVVPSAASALAARRSSIGASLSLGLESVEEVPEGSLRIKSKVK